MKTDNRVRTALLAGWLSVAGIALSGCGSSDVAPVAEHHVAVDHALHAKLPADVKRRGELVIGTDPSYAPMSSYAGNGRTIVGMEPDLATALGDVLGVRVKVRDVDFEKLADQVNSHKIDIAMSAMTDTPQRARAVDFVDYFSAGTAIVVQRGNPQHIASLRGLCGQQVAVERGTVQVDLLEHQQTLCGADPIKVTELANNSDALLRLRTGRTSAVLSDLPPAALVTHARATRQFYELASPTQYDPGFYGIVVAKGDDEMLSTLVSALASLVDDGEYARILKKWNLQTGAIDGVMVNSGRNG